MTENNKIYDGKYVKGNKASKLLGIHQRTLYQWEEKGIIETIRTPGGHRLYNVEKFLKKSIIEENGENYNEIDKMDGKLNVCYVRVSTNNQKDDLERQKEMMKKKYPNHKIIEDIQSTKKKGVQKNKHIKLIYSNIINIYNLYIRDAVKYQTTLRNYCQK